jgi:hypothetical protein
MRLHGLVQSAELQERPPESGQIEMDLRVQGVGPGQPRRLVVPFSVLVADETLDPERITGCAFEAEVALDPQGRTVVSRITFSGKMLRPKE